MKKAYTSLQVAAVIAQNSNAKITHTSLCKRMLENGMEMSAFASRVALKSLLTQALYIQPN